MAKKLVAFRLEEETVEALKRLSKQQKRSQANMLEILIAEATTKSKNSA